jgi:hypothetical protein
VTVFLERIIRQEDLSLMWMAPPNILETQMDKRGRRRPALTGIFSLFLGCHEVSCPVLSHSPCHDALKL